MRFNSNTFKIPEKMVKIFLKSSFILLIVALICHTALGFPIESSKRSNNNNGSSSSINSRVADENNQVGEGSLDLKRISNGTSSNESSSNNSDELDSVASANLLSVLGDLDGSTVDLDGVHRQLLQPESSHLLSMNLLPGKRRFDDNTALASTGQARGNRFIMPNSQVGHDFKPQPQSQLFITDTSNLNNYINEALLDNHRPPKPLADQRGPRTTMNSQPRSMPAMAERRQLNIRPKMANGMNAMNGQAVQPSYNSYLGNRQNQAAFRPQESIKRPSEPRGELEQERGREADSYQEIKDSDIFKDEVEEKGGSVEKRTGEQVDYDDNDEADEVDQDQNVALNARASTSSKLQAEQQQQQQQQFRGKPAANNPMRGIEDAAANVAADQDEDIDSTNVEAKRSRALTADLIQIRGGENQVAGSTPDDDGGKLEKENDDLKLDSSVGDEDEASAASQLDKSATDLHTAAGHHHGHSHGHYYQYAGVPKKKAWKFGFKRGNHKHTISREEKGYKNKFHSSFKWHAKEKCKKHKKCESVGKMSWHYEHHDKKKKHHHY